MLFELSETVGSRTEQDFFRGSTMFGFQNVVPLSVRRAERVSQVSCSVIKYYRGANNRSRAAQVDWMIEELGIQSEFEFIKLDISEKEHTDKEKNVHPFMKIPAMKLDDADESVIFESANILSFLARRFDGLDLSDAQRAEMNSWIVWINASFGPALVNEKTRSNGFKSLDVLEEILSTRSHLCAFDKFSAADIAVTYMLTVIGKLIPFPNLDGLPNLKAYLDRNTSRTAYKESMTKE